MKPPALPPPPLPSPQTAREVAPIAAIALFCCVIVGASVTMFVDEQSIVPVAMRKIMTYAPVPECGWYATLICTEMSDGERECNWDKTWRCGYALSWPKTVVRRPFAEEVIKERYP